MRFTPVPDYGDDIGSLGAVVGFDTPEEVSLFEQLVRNHKAILEMRLSGVAEVFGGSRARAVHSQHQLDLVQQWLTELTKEGEHGGEEEPQ